jgi:hypothetical protein
MTRQTMKTLKGWSIGVGTAVALGTVVVFSSAKTSSEKAMEDIYLSKIIFRNDTSMIEYPSLFGAHDLTQYPMEDIKNAVINGTKLNGYEVYKLEE